MISEIKIRLNKKVVGELKKKSQGTWIHRHWQINLEQEKSSYKGEESNIE